MGKGLHERLWARVEATMAWLGHTFITRWGAFERGYRRPYARMARRLRFNWYPVLALLALAWLAWDWHHDRSLASAENAIFDQVITMRPFEPEPSGKVAVVEIDDCSIEYYREQGLGGWPWSRQRHADLLDALDRAGVHAAGYDVQFIEPSTVDPMGDAILEAMAEGGAGRFIFGSTLPPQSFAGTDNQLPISQAPGAFAIVPEPERPGPGIVLLWPYGESMARYSALLDADRDDDGLMRDVTLRREYGDWALPSISLALAAQASGRPPASFPASVRINWRTEHKMPYVSAVDLIEGAPICDVAGTPPDLDGAVVMVGYTAAGLNDAKPTPVDAAMPGVQVHAEAIEALLMDSGIWMPPPMFKYLLAGLLVALTGFVFWRGEPSWDMDAIFVAGNLLLVALAFIGLTAFGVFFDIFAALGFSSLVFGLCRSYAATQRGYSIGNDDYRPQFDPDTDRWLALARLRFVPDEGLDEAILGRRIREYRRRLRGFVYTHSSAVVIEGIVEYKHWLYESLLDVNVLIWSGQDKADVAERAQAELRALREHLAGHDDILPDDGSVRVASLVSEAVGDDESLSDTRARVCSVLGRLLATPAIAERPLSDHDAFAGDEED
ncbi:CHASE2 domain-containing protein [Luteimonas sp. 8-5]|uniref:CHASE2 domain-containing protein n=1 Tax=Luteimonas sp. 8-5 TaxID=3039387 RepID=UPI0024371B43|nr:CHASE2 domain-containing protein [Luteimonas sp. 8-5]MDG6349416.1 CHASE2 domain-containing protein [Luteimonas sp. 8-5]